MLSFHPVIRKTSMGFRKNREAEYGWQSDKITGLFGRRNKEIQGCLCAHQIRRPAAAAGQTGFLPTASSQPARRILRSEGGARYGYRFKIREGYWGEAAARPDRLFQRAPDRGKDPSRRIHDLKRPSSVGRGHVAKPENRADPDHQFDPCGRYRKDAPKRPPREAGQPGPG